MTAPVPAGTKEDQLKALYGEYAKTPVLQELAEDRRLVPGAGPPDAPLVVVGEAPGAQEAEEGEPFVGAAGRLLQQLFDEARLPWKLCYRMNVIPWRPPGNRTPYPFQVHASQRRVEREIDIISPVFVVAAGAVAWRAVSHGDMGAFSGARGRLCPMPWKDWAVLPVWHPSAILRAHGKERQEMKDDTVSALASLRREAGPDAV